MRECVWVAVAWAVERLLMFVLTRTHTRTHAHTHARTHARTHTIEGLDMFVPICTHMRR